MNERDPKRTSAVMMEALDLIAAARSGSESAALITELNKLNETSAIAMVNVLAVVGAELTRLHPDGAALLERMRAAYLAHEPEAGQ